MKRGWSLALLLLAAFFSCQKREVIPDVPEMPEPRMRSIHFSLQTVVLPDKGSVEQPFSVKDPDYVFQEIRLTAADGTTPKAFSLKEVVAGREQGSYTAVLVDNGLAEPYEQEVCFVIPVRNPETGVESFYSSPYFTTSATTATPRPC